MELEILTDRLRLRPLRMGDVDLAVEMFTDPEVLRYVGGTDSVEEIKADMANVTKRCAGGRIGVWCVIDRESSEKLRTGALLPMPIDEDDTNWDLVEGPDIPEGEIEVEYILKRSAWGARLCPRDLHAIAGVRLRGNAARGCGGLYRGRERRLPARAAQVWLAGGGSTKNLRRAVPVLSYHARRVNG
jgi:hypothetical protein